jgi:hypothetical protein
MVRRVLGPKATKVRLFAAIPEATATAASMIIQANVKYSSQNAGWIIAVRSLVDNSFFLKMLMIFVAGF